MKNTFIVILLLLASVLGFAQQVPKAPATLSDNEFIEQVYYPATVLLYAQNEQGDMKFRCTATAFERKDNMLSHTYRFITASHCAADMAPLTTAGLMGQKTLRTWFYVTTDDTQEKKFVKAKVLGVGKLADGNDFSVIEATMHETLPIVPLGVDSTHTYGESLFNVSVPLGTGKQVLLGRITAPKINRPIEEGDFSWSEAIMVQIPGTNGGSSGSSIVCATQRAICGVFVGGISGTEGVALPISRFQTWYQSLNSKPLPNLKAGQ